MEENEKIEEPKEPKRAKHAADVPEYVENSKKMRRNLVIAIAVLIVILCIVAAMVAVYFLTSQNVSVQQQQETDVSQMENSEGDTSSSASEKSATVPDLALLVGAKADDAVVLIGHGAQVSADEAKEEENNPVKRTLRLTLTNDVSSDSSGNPTVLVSANSEGDIISVTYTASTKSLGYGTMSFSDAIQNERIIEKVMKEAGMQVSSENVVLPENKAEWTTYTDDGKRISREEKEFSGEIEGKKWSARLAYDYTVSLATDNLSDTLRNISITISS